MQLTRASLARGVAAVAVAAAVLAPGLSAAEPVATGRAARVVRARATRLPRIVFVAPLGDRREVHLVALQGTLTVGERYDVFDDGGRAAEVRVARVDRADDTCPGATVYRGRAEIVTLGHPFDTLDAVAVGPTDEGWRRGRLLQREAADLAHPPPPGSTPALITLVDLTGDTTPELARYLFDCKRGATIAWSGTGAACLEDWGRDEAGWRSLGRTSFACK